MDPDAPSPVFWAPSEPRELTAVPDSLSVWLQNEKLVSHRCPKQSVPPESELQMDGWMETDACAKPAWLTGNSRASSGSGGRI